MLVGFSPPDRLAAIARRLGWSGQVLGDLDRVLYQRLGLGRAPWWRVYSPGTVATYIRHLGQASGLPASGEDTRQLGGDAVTTGTEVVALWRPRSPDDRPAAGEVLARAATAVAAVGLQ